MTRKKSLVAGSTPVTPLIQPLTRKERVLLCQTIVPDYRLPLFQELKRRFGNNLTLTCGQTGFAPALRTSQAAWPLRHELKNSYWFSRALLWQHDLLGMAQAADLVIVEFNLRTISTWLVLRWRARRGKPTIMWGHATGRNRKMYWLKRWMFRRCQGFIAYTESQATQIRTEFPGLPVWVAPNAVLWGTDYRFISQPESEVTDIIYVGRLVAEKKPGLLLEAFVLAVQTQRIPLEAKLVFVGDGPERNRLESLALASDFGARIEFKGHIGDVSQLRELYSHVLFSVSPGYVGLSATQSFSFGVPMLIALNEAHSPEIEACQAGRNTKFFQANEAADMARGMEEFFLERLAWIGRRAAICQHTKLNYSLDRMTASFCEAIFYFLPELALMDKSASLDTFSGNK